MHISAAAQERDPIEFAGVRFAPDDVSEMDGGQVAVKVQRHEIQRIALRDGFYSAHPFLQVVSGLVLTAIAVPPTWHLARWVVGGGTFVHVEAWLVTLMFIGPWLVYDALKRGPHFDVETATGRKKLILDRRANLSGLEQYLSVAETRFGYSIDRRVDRDSQNGKGDR